MFPSTLTLPPPLKPGDLLYAIAPSGPLREQEAVKKGIAIWKNQGYRVEFGSNWNASCGYLAGYDQQRREALIQAWGNPECKGILCIRGGYGATRLLEDWDWQITNKQPITNSKWLIGFSDITALLWSLAKVGIGGVHGPLLTTIAEEPEWSLQRLFDSVSGGSLTDLQGRGWGGGKTRGVIVPANLTVATALLATPWQPSFTGTILALEDVSEAPYRLDRMLTQWRMSGILQGVKGIALGHFSCCQAPPGISSWTVEEVLLDRLGDLNIPIVSNLPFGHDGENAALPVGQAVELDGDQGILRYI